MFFMVLDLRLMRRLVVVMTTFFFLSPCKDYLPFSGLIFPFFRAPPPMTANMRISRRFRYPLAINAIKNPSLTFVRFHAENEAISRYKMGQKHACFFLTPYDNFENRRGE